VTLNASKCNHDTSALERVKTPLLQFADVWDFILADVIWHIQLISLWASSLEYHWTTQVLLCLFCGHCINWCHCRSSSCRHIRALLCCGTCYVTKCHLRFRQHVALSVAYLTGTLLLFNWLYVVIHCVSKKFPPFSLTLSNL